MTRTLVHVNSQELRDRWLGTMLVQNRKEADLTDALVFPDKRTECNVA